MDHVHPSPTRTGELAQPVIAQVGRCRRPIFVPSDDHMKNLLVLCPNQMYRKIYNILKWPVDRWHTDEQKALRANAVCPLCRKKPFTQKITFTRHLLSSIHVQMLADAQETLSRCQDANMVLSKFPDVDFLAQGGPREIVRRFEPPPPELNFDEFDVNEEEEGIVDEDPTVRILRQPEPIPWDVYREKFLEKGSRSYFVEAIDSYKDNPEYEMMRQMCDGIIEGKDLAKINFEKFRKAMRPIFLAVFRAMDTMRKFVDVNGREEPLHDCCKRCLRIIERRKKLVQDTVLELLDSAFLQKQYIKHYYCEGKDTIPIHFLTATGETVEIGHYIDPEMLIRMILSNASLVNHLEERRKIKEARLAAEAAAEANPHQNKKQNATFQKPKVWKSRLDCSKSKLDQSDGQLKLVFGQDDYSVTHQVLGERKMAPVYVYPGDIPTEYTRSRKAVYAVAHGDRTFMNQVGATTCDLLRPIIQRLKPIFANGINVPIIYPDRTVRTINVGVCLASVCCDNMGKSLVGGYQIYYGEVSDCTACSASRIQFGVSTDASRFPMLGPKDKAEYQRQLDIAVAIRNYAEMRKFNENLEKVTADLRESVRVTLKIPQKDVSMRLIDECEFLKLSSELCIFEILPLDSAHNVALGVALLALDLLFQVCELDLYDYEICQRIQQFTFYHEAPRIVVSNESRTLDRKNHTVDENLTEDQLRVISVRTQARSKAGSCLETKLKSKPRTSSVKKYAIYGKAVQVMELVMRFGEIFYDALPSKKDNPGIDLYLSLQTICRILFAYSITQEDREILEKQVKYFLDKTIELRQDYFAYYRPPPVRPTPTNPATQQQAAADQEQQDAEDAAAEAEELAEAAAFVASLGSQHLAPQDLASQDLAWQDLASQDLASQAIITTTIELAAEDETDNWQQSQEATAAAVVDDDDVLPLTNPSDPKRKRIPKRKAAAMFDPTQPSTSRAALAAVASRSPPQPIETIAHKRNSAAMLDLSQPGPSGAVVAPPTGGRKRQRKAGTPPAQQGANPPPPEVRKRVPGSQRDALIAEQARVLAENKKRMQKVPRIRAVRARVPPDEQGNPTKKRKLNNRKQLSATFNGVHWNYWLTIKEHNLLHHTQEIDVHSVPQLSNTLIFERKHTDFKLQYSGLGSYKNPHKSLLTRLMHSQAVHFKTSNYAKKNFFKYYNHEFEKTISGAIFEESDKKNLPKFRRWKKRDTPMRFNKRAILRILNGQVRQQKWEWIQPEGFYSIAKLKDPSDPVNSVEDVYLYGPTFQIIPIDQKLIEKRPQLRVFTHELIPFHPIAIKRAEVQAQVHKDGKKKLRRKYVAKDCVSNVIETYAEINIDGVERMFYQPGFM